ncbi:hypothetical protein GCM10022215_39110 [Nocardioides fonticola]|uniref:TPM domain-containing protein n=1 Tax=Nocardioides fonticola TaxID=450363 RepID=A0ABP7XZ16_9ACTN
MVLAVVVFICALCCLVTRPAAPAARRRREQAAARRRLEHIRRDPAEVGPGDVESALAAAGIGPFDVALVMLHAERRMLSPLMLWSLIERFGARVTAIAVVAETSMGELAAHLMRDRTPDAEALAVFAAANGLSAAVCGSAADPGSSVRSTGHGPF